MSTPLPSHPCCERRPSPVHGIGVFALRALAVGEVACTYGEARRVFDTKTGIYLGQDWSVDERRFAFTHVSPGVHILGDRQPTDPRCIAQFINDSISLTWQRDTETVLTLGRSFLRAWAESWARVNIRLVVEHDQVVARVIAPIAPDQELLTSYLGFYWFWAEIKHPLYPKANVLIDGLRQRYLLAEPSSQASEDEPRRFQRLLQALAETPDELWHTTVSEKFCSQLSCPQSQDLRRCQGCGIVRYCSRACQKKHWVLHKPYCRQWSQES